VGQRREWGQSGGNRGQKQEARLIAGSRLSTIPNSAVQVTIGNQPAPQPFFVGLAPGYVGLYQVNVIVPQGVQTGSAVPVTIGIQGQTSFRISTARDDLDRKARLVKTLALETTAAIRISKLV
jgi:uncharacterized protein (TIGR03437 family)